MRPACLHKHQAASPVGATGSSSAVFDKRMKSWSGLGRRGSEQCSGPGEQRPVLGVAHAVRADFDTSIGQDVLKKTPPKLFRGQSTSCALSRGRFLLLKRDVAIFQCENAVVADGHAKDVRRKIAQGVLTTADGLTVDDPVDLPYGRIDEREEVSRVPLVSELGSAEPRQRCHVEEAVWA